MQLVFQENKFLITLTREHAVSVKMLNHEFDEHVKNNDLNELTQLSRETSRD